MGGKWLNNFFDSALHPFKDYFSSYEMGQSVGGAKTGEPQEKTPGTSARRLGLSHMCPARNHTRHSDEMIECLSTLMKYQCP